MCFCLWFVFALLLAQLSCLNTSRTDTSRVNVRGNHWLSLGGREFGAYYVRGCSLPLPLSWEQSVVDMIVGNQPSLCRPATQLEPLTQKCSNSTVSRLPPAALIRLLQLTSHIPHPPFNIPTSPSRIPQPPALLLIMSYWQAIWNSHMVFSKLADDYKPIALVIGVTWPPYASVYSAIIIKSYCF